MTEIDWRKIRTHKQSQNNAFEELVCQLAYNHRPSKAENFVRVEAPDGGVESYWILSSGEEVGWQAKYHINEFGSKQWTQIQESFYRALDTHPALTQYYIALPIGFEDPRIGNKKSKQDRWNEYTEKWKNYAKAKGRSVQFELWGAFHLNELLTKPENEGKRQYWFNDREWTNEWFKTQLEDAIQNLGSRYTPKLNLELDISKDFTGIFRNRFYKSELDKAYHHFLLETDGAFKRLSESEFSGETASVSSAISAIKDLYARITCWEIRSINQKEWNQELNVISKNCDIVTRKLDDLDKLDKDTKIAKGLISSDDNNYRYYTHTFGYEKQAVSKCAKQTRELIDFINGSATDGFNVPFILLKGEKGMGKSHLLADIAEKNSDAGYPSLLLLGQHFNNEDPWSQILSKYGFYGSKETFLASLNAKAEANQSRIVIIIDAINEGAGISLWPNHVRGVINSIRKYPWLGLILSVRTPYENIIFDEQYIKDTFTEIIHHGFDESQYEASKLFFKEYGIEQPKIPLLYPEFRQPLFLKLFCDGLKKAKMRSIPKEGYEGISEITSFLISSINKELAQHSRLKFSASINIVEMAIGAFINEMIRRNSTYLPYADAHLLLENQFSSYNIKSGILEELISEGLLAKTLYRDENKYKEGVYFTFQRYEDHFRAKFLLDTYYDPKKPKSAFLKKGGIGSLFLTKDHFHVDTRLLEALAIQIPEITGLELFEAFSSIKDYGYFIHAVIDSLQWRKADTINKKVLDYLGQYLGNEDIFKRFLDTVLLISGKPKHYLNANFLHHWLSQLKMADRDVLWTMFINKHYVYHYSIKRLVDWGWSDDDKSGIEDESIFLIGTTLCWLFTSSNRNLRDGATKALTCIIRNRLDIAVKLIERFKDVDDIGVLERTIAASYGAALMSQNKSHLQILAQYIYDTFFKQRYIIPHILLRDYARNIIEYAAIRNCALDFESKNIQPPYRSKWYVSIPSKQDLKQLEYDYKASGFKDYYWSQNAILNKVFEGQDDFDKDAIDRIVKNWKVSLEEVQRILIKTTFELGYDVEKHGQYDRHVSDYFNNNQKIEPIGKKYLWQAFYELSARTSDNKEFRSRYSKNYEGPWEPYLRDIDPTMAINKTLVERYTKGIMNKNWFNISYSNWDVEDKTWIHQRSDIPQVDSILQVKDNSGEDWIQLDAQLRWESPTEIGTDKYSEIRKELGIDVEAYIISANEIDRAVKYLNSLKKGEHFYRHNSSVYEVFSREYYWSSAYHSCITKVEEGFSIPRQSKNEADVHCKYASLAFLWEQPQDHSKEQSIHFIKPSAILFAGLNMKNSLREGEYLNQADELICFDPSVNNQAPSCLLVRKKELLNFLRESGMSIVWSIQGEKRLLGRNYRPNDKRYWGENYFKGFYKWDNENFTGKLVHNIQERNR